MKALTSVEPVNATLSMLMWLAMAAPAVGPNPGRMFTTPGGKPACVAQSQVCESLGGERGPQSRAEQCSAPR